MKGLKRWLFGKKFCVTADIYEKGSWSPINRYFWYGGLFTKRKVNVFRLLRGRFTAVGENAGIQKTFELYLDNLCCKSLEPLEGATPGFVWPDWYVASLHE